jgi:hypothetical protein
MRAHQNDGKTGWRRRRARTGTGGQYLQLETSAPFGQPGVRARIFSTYIRLYRRDVAFGRVGRRSAVLGALAVRDLAAVRRIGGRLQEVFHQVTASFGK